MTANCLTANGSGRYPVTLAFALIECSCGIERVRGVACPDCGAGANWFETDVEWQRRHRMMKRALAILDGPSPGQATPQDDDIDYPRLFADVADLTPRFFRELQGMAERENDDATAMVRVCRDAMGLSAMLRERMPRRPWVLTADTAATATASLLRVMREFLRAFGARTPLEAQRLAAAAQEQLDAVVGPVSEFNNLHDRWELISEADDVAEWLSFSLRDAGEEAGTANIAELDAVGRRAYADITGRTPVHGVGVALVMQQLNAKLMGDESKFNGALRAADQVIERNRERFEQILQRPEVVAEMRTGMLQLGDQVAEMNAVVAATANERQTVRAVVALMHTMFEGPGRRFAGLFLEVVGKGRFESRLAEDGAGTVHTAQEDRRLKHVFYGLNRALRIAHAHQSYVIHDDYLMLRHRDPGGQGERFTRLPLAQVLDHFLAGAECLNALSLAVQAAALEVDVELVGPEVLEAMGAGPEAVMAFMLADYGYENVVVDDREAYPQLGLVGSSLSTYAVATITRTFPDCDVVSIDLERPEGTQHWTVNAKAYRLNAAMDEGIEKEMNLQEVLSSVTLDGTRLWDAQAVQTWVAGRACEALQAQSLSDAYPTVMREMRALVRFSVAHGFDELAAALKGIMGFLRHQTEGAVGDPGVFDELARCTPTRPVPELFTLVAS